MRDGLFLHVLPLAFEGDWVTPFWRVVAALTGMVVGSFLNVVIWRLPLGMSLMHPPSACPGCKTPIRWFDNIPVLGWLWLLGRCRSCKMPISFRYPMIEALTGVLFLLAAIQWQGDPVTIVVVSLALAALVAISFIDLDHRIIPDVISLPGTAFGIATAPFIGIVAAQYPDGFLTEPAWLGAVLFAVIGAAVGAGVVMVVRVLGSFVLKKEAMGLGDVKLLAMIGAFVGPVWVLYALVAACFGGAVIGLAMYVVARLRAIPCEGVVMVGDEPHTFDRLRIRDRTLLFTGKAPDVADTGVVVTMTMAAHRVLTDEDVEAVFEGRIVASERPGTWAVRLDGPFESPERESAYKALEAFAELGVGARARFFLVLGVFFGLAALVATSFGQPLLFQVSGIAALIAFGLYSLRRPGPRPCQIEARAKGKSVTAESARLDDAVLVFDAPRSVPKGAKVALSLTLPAAAIGADADATVEATGKVVRADARGDGAVWHVRLDEGFVSDAVADRYDALEMLAMSARYIPFGPFLSLAGAAMLLFGSEVAWLVGTGFPEWMRTILGR